MKEWIRPSVDLISVSETNGPNTRGPKDGNAGKTHPVFPSGKGNQTFEFDIEE